MAQTRWLFRPKICAANWAAASGERMVEQPRPAEERGLGHKDGLKDEKKKKRQSREKCSAHRLAYARRTRHLEHPSLE